MGFYHPENKFVQFIEKTVDLAAISLLWIVCCITVVGAGSATTALYYTAAKSVKRGRSYPIREFFRALKRNWWKSMWVWILLILFGISLYMVDLPCILLWGVSGTAGNPILFAASVVKLFLFIGILLYVFPVLSRFDVSIWKALSVSVVLMIRHIFTTLLLALLMTVSAIIVWLEPAFLLLVPGVCAFVCTIPLEWVLQKYMEGQEKEPDPSRDQWYLEH